MFSLLRSLVQVDEVPIACRQTKLKQCGTRVTEFSNAVALGVALGGEGMNGKTEDGGFLQNGRVEMRGCGGVGGVVPHEAAQGSNFFFAVNVLQRTLAHHGFVKSGAAAGNTVFRTTDALRVLHDESNFWVLAQQFVFAPFRRAVEVQKELFVACLEPEVERDDVGILLAMECNVAQFAPLDNAHDFVPIRYLAVVSSHDAEPS